MLARIAGVGRTGTSSLALASTLSLLLKAGTGANSGGSLDRFGLNPPLIDEFTDVVGLDG
jgi:hypothetical protein